MPFTIDAHVSIVWGMCSDSMPCTAIHHPRPICAALAFRLFVHFSFFSKAVAYCRAHPGVYPPESYSHLYDETVKISLRAQSFFSVGLRALYLFIPLVRLPAWTQMH